MFQKVKGYSAEKQKFVFGSSFKRSKGVNYIAVGSSWCPVDSLLFSSERLSLNSDTFFK